MSEPTNTTNSSSSAEVTWTHNIPTVSYLSWQVLESARNMVRHDECDYLFDEMKKLKHKDDEEWYDIYTKEDQTRPLSQQEIWNLAIEEALLVLDGRMTWLREQ